MQKIRGYTNFFASEYQSKPTTEFGVGISKTQRIGL
jgi:hypothetical protein